MIAFLAFAAFAADLELELTSPSGVPVRVVLPDVVAGPLPGVTIPASDDVPAYRFGFTLAALDDGAYQLDVRIEEVKILGGGRERYVNPATPRITFRAGEASLFTHARVFPDHTREVIYAVEANIVE